MQFSILKKFLFAFLLISLVPLLVLSLYARQKLIEVGESAVQNSKQALLDNSASLLEARARAIARQVELLLEVCEDDLRALSLLPFDPDLYFDFSRAHLRRIWVRRGTRNRVEEVKQLIPLYREVTYVDPGGVERIRVHENNITLARRHVALPFIGSFGKEDYYNEARALAPGDIYVSHLLGRHVRREEQLQGAPDVESAVGGAEYEGIIRFAMAVYRDGAFVGVVSLALDHRHLMEYTQHVLPIGDHEVVFPSYASGNYAFLFDDEGWIITHPKFWDIRGHDPDTGRLIDPESPDYTEAAMKAGRVPFNLLHVPFIHENYQLIARSVLSGESGVTTTSSVGDVNRVMAFAPIAFDSGVYRQTGFFGGVTLGARSDAFHRPVEETATVIHKALALTVQHFVFIIIITGMVVALMAILLARSFSRPIQILNHKVRDIGAGRFDVSVEIKSRDELESLGRNFQKMAGQLENNRRQLVQYLRELEASKKEAVRERDFIQEVFANVVSGLLVIDRKEVITVANQNAAHILGYEMEELRGDSVAEALSDYSDLIDLIRGVFQGREASGVDLEIVTIEGRKYIEVTASSLRDTHSADDRSVLVVIRDITHRKKMEQYLRRSDRLVSLGTLAAGVAHEVRNPLTGISLMLDDLHDRMTDRPEDQGLMRMALEEMEKLETIVNELLDFAANPSTRHVPVELGSVIENTLFLIQKQCKRQHVLLVRDIDSELPPIQMDPEKMKQALLNILLNALHVMPEGGELHVLALRRENLEMFTGPQEVEIRICDTGPGVAPEDMDYIFDPFFTRTPEGSGLGLSITHTIIEEHGGKIMVDSKLGRGACFKIFFPLLESESGENPSKEEGHAENLGGG
ncbi:MAG: ATP-binding protein [Thermodesulfobacteriota bacterium]